MKHTYKILQTFIVLLSLFTVNMNAQVVNTESFDGTTFLPTGWSFVGTPTTVWSRVTSGGSPTQSTHSGAGEAMFNSFNVSTANCGIVSPPFSLQNNTSGASFSFWMYRDIGYSTTADKIDVYYNTSASLTGATLMGTINRSSALSPSVAVDGWYQYSYVIPNTVTSSNVYLILNGTSAYGNNIFIDDISWTSYPPICSGTPATPTSTISTAVGCPNTAFNINTSGATSALGISYQWQASNAAAGTYTSIPGATTTAYASSVSATTYYRMITTCSVSALSSTTSVLSYSVNNPGPCVCNTYGSSVAGSTGDEEIVGVVFGSLNNVSTCTTVAAGPGSIQNRYSNYAGILTAPDICLGAAVPFTVNVGTCGSYYTISLAIFIDLNQNGSFADAGEQLFVNNGGVVSGNATGTVNIPLTALTGLTRMRIVLSETSTTPGPTGAYTWGETEDYCVNFLASPTISLTSNSASICPGGSFTVTASGASTYTFSAPSGTLSGTTVTLSPIVNTIYTVSGTAVNGCKSPTATMATATISTLVSPTLVATASTASICPGISTSLTVSGANTYTWTSPASNATLVSVNPSVTTIYTVSGTGTNVCNGFKTVTVTVFPTPTISVNSGSICAGKVFTMTPTGASTYTFTGPGTATVSPTSSTVYTVTGTSANGCLTSTATIGVSSVSVIALPTVVVSGGTVCAGSPYVFLPTGATSYTFVNSSNPITPTASASYSVIGTTSIGCVSLPAIANITVFALPSLSVAATPTDMVICANSPLNLTASGAATYTWNNTASGATFSDTPQTSGSYFVIGTDANGCTNLSTVPYTVNPQPPISVVTTNTFLCVGKSATLTAAGALTYTWTTNANTTSEVVSPTVTTIYGVTGTNTFNCTKTVTLSVVVNTINMTVSSNTAICNGNATDLTATGATAYTWSPGNTPFPTTNVSPAATTVYTVTGKDSKNCFHTAFITVTVNANPTVTASGSSSVICIGESATLTASGASTYSWNSLAALPTSTGNIIVVGPTNSSTYNYYVTGTDANGCSSVDTIALKVDKCTGITKITNQSSGLSVYPNPTNGEFTVELNNGLTKNIQISDVTGRIILTEVTSEDKATVNINAYSKGIYYVKIQSDNAIEVIKVIKN